MENIELKIKIKNQEKLPDFMELLEGLDYVEVENDIIDDGDTKEEIIENVKQGVKELKLVLEGKMKTRPLKEVLDEL